MKKIYVCLGCLLFSFHVVAAKGYFKFSAPLKKAYHYVFELRFKEARDLVKKERESHPDNLMTEFIANYIDYYKVVVSDNKAIYNQLVKNKNKRISRIKAGDKNSPYYLYTQAEIRLQWAIAKQQFGDYISAVREMNRAEGLFRKNQKKFPKFIANLKGLGLIHATFGAIPDEYKWIKNILNFKGTLPQGLRELKKVATYSEKHDFIFAGEAMITYAVTVNGLGNDEKTAWRVFQHPKIANERGPLFAFMRATFALQTKHGDAAIQILENCRVNPNAYPCHQLHYLKGKARLFQLNKKAINHFQDYIKNFKGRQDIKDAYLRIAYHHLIHGNESQYWEYLDLCKTKGQKASYQDTRAQKVATARKKLNVMLLKADLLYNGGHGKKALAVLNQKQLEDFQTEKDKINYIYLKGRITQYLKQYDIAIEHFKQTITLGRNKPDYFACSAALQLGLIYENKGGWNSTAKRYYRMCLSMKPNEYRSGLHNKAKAGLSRLK